MGLYTGRQVFTATAASNLAGKLEGRANFRKSAVVASILSGSDEGLGPQLNRSYLNGPGTKLRQFHRWAQNHYSDIGLPYESRLNIKTAVANDIRPLVQNQLLAGENVAIQGIEIGEADYQYFAEQFMWANYPDKMGGLWTAEIDEDTQLISIFEGETLLDSFVPADFDRDSLYLYAPYRTANANGIFIYRFGSGDPVLDPLIEENLRESEAYYPAIPVRMENEFVSDTHKPQVYNLAKRAFSKATGARINEVIDSLEEDPENLDKIDYAYVVFGASVSSSVRSQQEYIFNWIKEIGEETGFDTPSSAYSEWKSDVPGHVADIEYWRTTDSLNDEESGSNDPPPGYDNNGDSQVGPDGAPSRPYRGVHLSHPGPLDINYDTRLVWTAISYTQSAEGLGKPDAKVGEYWWGATDNGTEYKIFSIGEDAFLDSDRKDHEVRLYHQVSETEYEYLTIVGMEQRTYVFGNNYEQLTLYDALTNNDVEESSFIIPLRYSTMANMSLVNSTEFALHSQYLVIHFYEIHTQSFLQSFLPISLIIVVVVVTVTTGGLGAGSVGILGTNAAVGAAVGASAATAAIVGFVVNTLAAIVLTTIIQKGTVALFGPKIGAIVGMVMSFLAINTLTNFAQTGQFALNFGDITRAENLLKLTNVAANAYQGYVSADIQQTLAATDRLMEDYNEESRRISELYATNIGYDRGVINPFDLVDSTSIIVESASVFLERTLMTGSDIAELSMSMLSNFTGISLSTNLPLQ